MEAQNEESIGALKYCLEKLGIGSTIKMRLRYGKNKKSELVDYISNDASIDLLKISQTENRLEILSHLIDGTLSLQTLTVEKNGTPFSLSDLSSGERAYMIALLGALFCVKPQALILFDEPENSLHPAWQKSILRDFQEVFAKRQIIVTTVLATHSPLVASSSSNRHTFTCNFPSEQTWHQSDLNGKTSDSALKEQFEVYSSRSPEVIRLVQRILKFISKGDLQSSGLLSSIDELISYKLDPTPGDPLHNILRTITHVRWNNELP
jgi:predicted ATP-binding protein involved in virulence